MSAGDRDQRVRFQVENGADDGAGGRIDGWANVGAEMWAKIEPTAGGERTEADQVQARDQYRVTIYNRRDLTAAMRLVWTSAGGRVLKIIDLPDPGARPTERSLVCEDAPGAA